VHGYQILIGCGVASSVGVFLLYNAYFAKPAPALM
jgi:hypothetical protein